MNPLLMNRRQALQFFAATPAFAKAFGAGSSHHMYLSLNSTLVTNRVPWPRFAELAAKVGFPGVDVMLDPAMKAGAGATNKLLRDLKVRPSMISAPVEFRKDDAAFKASLPKLEAAAQFAAAIDCPRMMTYIMPSSETPKDELRRIYKQRFTECSRILAKSNIRLGLEFLGPLHLRKAFPHEFIWRMNEMLEFAKECGPNIGITLDAWHWHHAGATVQDIVNAGRERIVDVHFDDAPDQVASAMASVWPDARILDRQGYPHRNAIVMAGRVSELQRPMLTMSPKIQADDMIAELDAMQFRPRRFRGSLSD